MQTLIARAKRYPFLAVGIAFLVLGVLLLVGTSFARPEVEKAESLTFEIADSNEERTRGLSGRTSVPEDGLLFVFPEAGRPGFWMKDMQFAIDIIWLLDTGEIVGIEHSVSPDTYPQLFYPSVPVRYVLEVPAGTAVAKKWEIGSFVPLPNLK